jgi:hypothetical protein
VNYYTVKIETGSCCAGDRSVRATSHYDCVCGRRGHRTYAAAEACRERLRADCDARWLSAEVHAGETGRLASPDGITDEAWDEYQRGASAQLLGKA